MAWAPQVVKVYNSMFGEPETVHTALPPFNLGGELVDVAEYRLEDGTAIYGTAGLSENGGWSAHEFVLHAESPDPRWAEMLARVGGSSRTRSYEHGGTLPLAGGDLSVDALGFFYAGRHIQVGESRVGLRQVMTLTQDEVVVARRDSLYTVEAMWWKDGLDRKCRDARPTSESIKTMTPIRPSVDELSKLSPDARDVIEIAIQGDHDGAESIRGHFTAEEAAQICTLVVDRFPHPEHHACLLHAMMDFRIPELAGICLRVLQLSPTEFSAPQCYADALAILAAIEENNWDKYFEYECNFDLCCAEAEKRRADAGVEIIFGLPTNPFLA